MTTLMMVFMVFAIMMCVFSALVITREIIRDSVERREKKTPAPAPVAPVAAEPAPVAETAAEEASEEPETEEAQEEEVAVAIAEPDDAVRFRPRNVQTLSEKYDALDSNSRWYYDEIARYAATKENVKHFKNDRSEDYKIGMTRLVRLLIKRGVVHCEFVLPNADFKNYVNENKVEVKYAPSTMKITDEAAVRAAKDSIDIVVHAIAQEKEYKKQLAREKRRQNRLNAQNKAE